MRQRSGTKNLHRPENGLSEFVGRTFDGFHFVLRFGVWKGEKFVDGHVCVPAVAVLPITAIEWDVADGLAVIDTWRRGNARSPNLVLTRFQGRRLLRSFLARQQQCTVHSKIKEIDWRWRLIDCSAE